MRLVARWLGRLLAAILGAVFLVVAALVRVLMALARRLLPSPRPRQVPEQESNSRAEWVVVLLLLGGAAAAVIFILIYALDIAHNTQFLGLALGVSLGLIAAALMVAARKLVPVEQVEEDYSEPKSADRAPRGRGAAAAGGARRAATASPGGS